MKVETKESETHSFVSLLHKDAQTAVAYFSVDIHSSSSLELEVTEYLYQELLLSGTKKLSREAFLDELNKLGSSISVSLSDGVVTYVVKSIATNYRKTLVLFEQLMLEPAFKNSELERVKKTAKNILNDSAEDSRYISHALIRKNLYKKNDRHYTYLPKELLTEIDKLTTNHFVSLHKTIRSTYLRTTVTGDQKTITDTYSVVKKLSPKEVLSPVAEQGQSKPVGKVVFEAIPSRQNIDFNIGAPLPITLHHPDYAALNFGLAVLGKWGGFAGRLMSTVREKEGLTYGIYAKLDGFYHNELGYWRIMTFFSPDKAIEGLTSTFREIKGILKGGVTDEEFTRFKNILKTQQVLVNDSASSRAAELHSFHQQGFSLEEMEMFKTRLLNVTKAEVNAALKKYIEPSKLIISAAGPIASVRKDITNFQKKQ